mgnify:CR=1 FL=1
MDLTQQVAVQQVILDDGPSGLNPAIDTEFLLWWLPACLLLSLLINWLFFWPTPPKKKTTGR